MTVVAKLRAGIAGAAAFAILGIALAGAPRAQAADPACPGGKVKYYRNPMGTPDTSPVPKKDSMNMDYIPVCEDTAGEAPGTVGVARFMKMMKESDGLHFRFANQYTVRLTLIY